MQNVARGRRVEPGDHPEKRGFAAARGADQDDEFAVLDREIDVAQHMRGAVALVDRFDVEIRPWGCAYLTAPAVRPLISCREKTT